MARKTTSMLGFGWEEFKRVDRAAEKSKVALKGLEKTFIYWMGEEEGGALTKRAANELAAKIIETILEQKDVITGVPELSDQWKIEKADAERWGGTPLDPRIGIATGQMINAIRPIDQGRGTWRVGISGNDRVSTKIGTITKIADYARILERGSSRQLPRPIFSGTFRRWVEDRFPQFLKETIINDLQPHLDKIAREIAENRADAALLEKYTKSGGREYDDAGRGTPVRATEGGLEEVVQARREGRDVDLYDFGQSEYDFGEERDPLGYEEAERTEQYVSQQHGQATLLVTKGSGDIWNWIDNKWQDAVTALERLSMYGAI
jgi:hypothetical protein